MIILNSVFLERKQKKIFSNLNLRVLKNEKLLIQGNSGVGKTTLLKVLLGFEAIDSGRVYVNHLPVDPLHIKNIRGLIFYLSQDIDLKTGVVSEFLDEIIFTHTGNALNSFQIEKWLSFLELDKTVLNQDSRDLSGGERQRVGWLIGFLLDRPVWLLDEPTSALEGDMKKRLMQKIFGMEKTLIIISHDDVWHQDSSVTRERW